MKKVLVLNPYLPTMGGGEKHMGYLCKFIEDYYNNDVKIDILVHNYNNIDINDSNYVTIEDLNKQFGLDLKNTFIRKIDLEKPQKRIKQALFNKTQIEQISKSYDLFINFMFLSKHIGKSKINIYSCMFPPKRFSKEIQRNMIKKIGAKYLDYRFFNSYDSFMSNSAFTNHWLGVYWKNTHKNTIIYPPVFSENEIYGRYNEKDKKNIIVSVGRFFVGAHSKKQLEMVQMFLNNKEKFKNYEYHLVGAVSNYPEDIEYLNKIKQLASQTDNIYIHENYPFEELMKLYRKAKIFWHATGYGENENLNPEKMEHFGITTIEAMSYGAVPIVIDKGGQQETVKEEINGYRWKTEAECINKTLKIINDEEIRIRMVNVCIEEAKKYSIEAFFEANRRLFNELRI
ncbi:glycosyltransferase [Clostridium botulinum]|nr:glycosyltransferase [Clostridium botulinum]NFO91419.1 glycosyltransferase [Clostridium botulinum]